MSTPLALRLDGRPVAADAPALPPTERGFTYGDGLFETIPAHAGAARQPGRHVARLVASAAALGLPAPDAATLEREIAAVLADAGPAAGVVRLTWSRGAGGRGYAPGPGTGPPRLLVGAYPAPAPLPPDAGVRAATVRGVAPGDLAGHKTLSAIHYVVAAQRARAAGADEALLVDGRGRVLETAGANVFAVLADRVVTPPAGLPLFPGIGRARALAALADDGAGPLEQAFDVVALARATEAFLVNAVRGVVPLVVLDGRPIGDGTPGPRTRALRARLTPGARGG